MIIGLHLGAKGVGPRSRLSSLYCECLPLYIPHVPGSGLLPVGLSTPVLIIRSVGATFFLFVLPSLGAGEEIAVVLSLGWRFGPQTLLSPTSDCADT